MKTKKRCIRKIQAAIPKVRKANVFLRSGNLLAAEEELSGTLRIIGNALLCVDKLTRNPLPR